MGVGGGDKEGHGGGGGGHGGTQEEGCLDLHGWVCLVWGVVMEAVKRKETGLLLCCLCCVLGRRRGGQEVNVCVGWGQEARGGLARPSKVARRQVASNVGRAGLCKCVEAEGFRWWCALVFCTPLRVFGSSRQPARARRRQFSSKPPSLHCSALLSFLSLLCCKLITPFYQQALVDGAAVCWCRSEYR